MKDDSYGWHAYGKLGRLVHFHGGFELALRAIERYERKHGRDEALHTEIDAYLNRTHTIASMLDVQV